MKLKKGLGIIFVLLLIANLVLIGAGLVNGFVFWGVIIVIGILARFVMPKLP
jgi:hypothetical protein